jgi:hypothetical protein
MKRNIFGNDKVRDLEQEIMEKSPRHVLLQSQHIQWTKYELIFVLQQHIP